MKNSLAVFIASCEKKYAVVRTTTRVRQGKSKHVCPVCAAQDDDTLQAVKITVNYHRDRDDKLTRFSRVQFGCGHNEFVPRVGLAAWKAR